ncbi:hypothetical protein Bca101_096007 [Brassica carinata]
MPTRACSDFSNKRIGTHIPRLIFPDQTRIHGSRPCCNLNQHGRDNDSNPPCNLLSKVWPTERLKIMLGSIWNRQRRELIINNETQMTNDRESKRSTETKS